MKPKIIITLLLLPCMLTSCWKEWGLCHDTELSFKKQDYNGNQLRLDGYYSQDDSSKNIGAGTIFLFRNGVSYNRLSGDTATPIHTSSDLIEKRSWGVFRVNGNNIEIEKWWALTYTCFRTTYIKGEIQNDTTFIITLVEDRKKKGKPDRTETSRTTFHFHASSPRPDSTNIFVD